LEKQGITIPDNVKRTLDLWQTLNYSPQRIVIICSPFAMKRAQTEWLKFPNYELEIIRKNSSVSEIYNRENWYKQFQGRNTVRNEYYKLQGEHLVHISLNQHGFLI